MYIDSGEGGILSTGIKMGLCGLFGVCGFFVPVVMAGCSAYLIKTKDIERFWIKTGLAFLALINVSALVNLSDVNNDIGLAFYFGYADYSGGGFLGACVSVFMEKMVQKIASYIILSLTLVILASVISNVSIFTAVADWIRDAVFNAK